MLDKKVYISGPENKNFIDAEEKLRAAGFTIVNPICGNDIASKDVALIKIAALSTSNYIYQLEGWQDSEEATAEWFIAKWMDILIVNNSWLDWYVEELERRKNHGKESKEKDDQNSYEEA